MTGRERDPVDALAGECPNGCGRTLFRGAGGYVTCSWHACPEPDVFKAWAARLEQTRQALAEAADAVIWMSGIGPIPEEALPCWEKIRDEQMPKWRAALGEPSRAEDAPDA